MGRGRSMRPQGRGLHVPRVRTGADPRGGGGGRPRGVHVLPPHLCLRAGCPPPGPGGATASREKRAAVRPLPPWELDSTCCAARPGCRPLHKLLGGPRRSARPWRARRPRPQGREVGAARPVLPRAHGGRGGRQRLCPPPGRAVGGDRTAELELPRDQCGAAVWERLRLGAPTPGSHSLPGSSWASCPPGRSSVVTEEGPSASCGGTEPPPPLSRP